MGIFSQLTEQKDFTPAEKAIADYILNNPDEIVGLGIADLAKQTYSSNPAIIRLCRKIGVSGYKEFRIAFAAELEKHRFEKHHINVNAPFSQGDTISSIMYNISTISQEALESCYASVSPGALEQAARLIKSARHIFIFAGGDTYVSALTFYNMLVKIGIHSVMANQYGEELSISYGATNQDVALFISYSGRIMKTSRKAMQILRRNGCRCILISSLSGCSDTKNLKYVVKFPPKEQSLGRAAGFYSQTCITYILHCLYGIIYTMDLEKNVERKTKADELIYEE